MRTGILLSAVMGTSLAAGQACVECHKKVTPGVVTDWQASRHSQQGTECATCHGEEHTSAQDAAKARIPTPETCAGCHPERVKQFQAGKHALVWAAMEAMPTIHAQPVALTEGMKGCGGCHKIGLKTGAEIKELQKQARGFGVASCDACHTRHGSGSAQSCSWWAAECSGAAAAAASEMRSTKCRKST